jgi:hypothetical protein
MAEVRSTPAKICFDFRELHPASKQKIDKHNLPVVRLV